MQAVDGNTLDFEFATSHFLSLTSEDRVLSIFPATLDAAEFHHVPETHLPLLAPQILWIV